MTPNEKYPTKKSLKGWERHSYLKLKAVLHLEIVSLIIRTIKIII
jgi:hypothetical protein